MPSAGAELTLTLFLVLGAPPTAPEQEQIAHWVRQLGATDYATRERATRLLQQAGEAAEGALRAALGSEDAEVVGRARALLTRIQDGIYPDTPPAVEELLGRYRRGDAAGKRAALQELFEQSKAGFRVVRKLAAAEPAAEVRRQLLESMAAAARQQAGKWLCAADVARTEELLEEVVAGGEESSLRDYAAFCVQYGRTEDKVRLWEARLRAHGESQSAVVLVYLYRARGDLQGALRAAERAADAGLMEQVLEELGHWQELARQALAEPGGEGAEAHALAAFYYHLAGDNERFEINLRKVAAEDSGRAALLLLLHGRATEAVAAFRKARLYLAAFDCLVARGDVREALELARNPGPDAASEVRWRLRLRLAEVLGRLGEKDQAAPLFADLFEEVKNQKDVWSARWQYERLIDAERRAGLRGLAVQHCARVLDHLEGDGGQERDVLLNELFPDNEGIAAWWWRFLRERFPGEVYLATLRRLEELCGDGRPGPGFVPLLQEAERAAEKRDAEQRATWLLQLADTCLRAGERARANAYLEKLDGVVGGGGSTGSWTVLLRLGDVRAQNGEWARAAERYEQAWQKNQLPALLYLRGWALAHAGREAEGRRLMECARRLPLANAEARSELARVLAEHGLREEARRENELIIRTAPFRSLNSAFAQAQLGDAAAARKDFLVAADADERVLVHFFPRELYTGDGNGLGSAGWIVRLGGRVHGLRAQALVASNHPEEGRHEIERSLALLPDGSGLPVALVVELTHQGFKEEADRLFERQWSARARLCAFYPQWAGSHHNLALLAASCRRRPDEALEHARTAVELAPGTTAYLGTLAEVYFQRGEKGQALELASRCLASERHNRFFQEQLQRITAGTSHAELPASGWSWGRVFLDEE